MSRSALADTAGTIGLLIALFLTAWVNHYRIDARAGVTLFLFSVACWRLARLFGE